ncbi:unnamed protein product, partial [Menidia menidia]
MASHNFKVSAFLENPFWGELEVRRKEDLFLIAMHFELDVTKQIVKKEMKSVVSNKLVEEGLLSVCNSPCLTPNEILMPAVLEEGQKVGNFKLKVGVDEDGLKLCDASCPWARMLDSE